MALLIVMGVLLGSCSSGVSPSQRAWPDRPRIRWPPRRPRVVVGHSSQNDSRTPLADARVGVYRQAVSSGGPILAEPPPPLATTTTNSAGQFTIQGLPAGRWFVLVLHQAGAVTWVPFDPATGAVITLVVCTDCPIPL